MATNSYPEFGHGAEGYGRYYYHTLLDTADSNFMVAVCCPVIFHQDNRFYTLGHGKPGKRALYAASRVLITRTDSGNKASMPQRSSAQARQPGSPPSTIRTHTSPGPRSARSGSPAVIIDSANYTFKEFWPDINRKIFHTRSNA